MDTPLNLPTYCLDTPTCTYCPHLLLLHIRSILLYFVVTDVLAYFCRTFSFFTFIALRSCFVLFSDCTPKCHRVIGNYMPAPRLSSTDDPNLGGMPPHLNQNYDPSLNNSVFEDPPPEHMTPVGAPRAMFDEDQEAANEPPPLVKRTSRPSLGSDSRGSLFCFYFVLFCFYCWYS